MNVWKRYELKDRAKQVLKVNYWIAFVVALILVIISGGMNMSNSGWRHNVNYNIGPNARWERQWDGDWENNWNRGFSGDYDTFGEFIQEFPKDLQETFEGDSFINPARTFLPFLFGFVLVIASVAGLVGLALRIFVINPLKMGCKAFFKTSAELPHRKMNDLGLGFRDGNYMPVVKTMFLRSLFTFLWSLLFIIPGIIKAYAYRMVPYILADNPKMDANEAITLSRRMMNGQKWRAFVLDLSFIGWYLLGLLALGIGVLFVHPYYHSTDAQLYLALRQNAINDGYFEPKSLNLEEAQA
jgi:uncharacterized membrane protein